MILFLETAAHAVRKALEPVLGIGEVAKTCRYSITHHGKHMSSESKGGRSVAKTRWFGFEIVGFRSHMRSFQISQFHQLGLEARSL